MAATNVPNDLLDWLRQNGFEVGVHDLRDDGSLFNSREAFESDANPSTFSSESGARSDFTLGLCLHKHDWIHGQSTNRFLFWVAKPVTDADAFRGPPEPARGSIGSSSKRRVMIRICQ